MLPLRPPSPSSQLPVGTRHRRKRLRKNNDAPMHADHVRTKTPAEDLAARLKELEMLPDLIKEKITTWKDGARPFQIDCMRAQILRQDLLLHAATGSGKTGIAAGPHLLPSSKGKVTLFVSPLLSLHDEQVGLLPKLLFINIFSIFRAGHNFQGGIWAYSCCSQQLLWRLFKEAGHGMNSDIT
jgi:hypothetical protein